MSISLATFAVLSAVVAAPAPAVEDSDLDRIPGALAGPAAEAPATPLSRPTRGGPHARLYLEDALTVASVRAPVVPFPPPPPYRWQDRASADLVADWAARASLKLTLSDRIDLIAQEHQTWWSRSTARNELREAYASWQPRARLYLEVGRINVRNGVALGFNPTDVFRPRTLVGQASLDPSVLSRNRLGTASQKATAETTSTIEGAIHLLVLPTLTGKTMSGSGSRVPARSSFRHS